MTELAKAHIEAFGWLCEDSLQLAAECDQQNQPDEATAYREAAHIWSDRAFKEATA